MTAEEGLTEKQTKEAERAEKVQHAHTHTGTHTHLACAAGASG